MGEFYKTDIKKFFNHKLFFGSSPQDCSGAGLDGVYIAKKDFKISEREIIDGTEFDFSFGNYDNSVCEGQRIKVSRCADKLHIIGFAYWGDTTDIFEIVLKDGSREYLHVPFPDWSHDHKDGWFFRTYARGNITSSISLRTSGELQIPVYLHHITADIPSEKEIDEIVLPDNFWLHIFAITLENTKNAKANNKK